MSLALLAGFVPNTSHIFEDSEWCWRLAKSGRKILYVPSATMWHHVSASVRKQIGNESGTGIPALALYLMNRNNLWTIRRHAKPIPRKVLSLVLSAGLIVKVMLLCLYDRDAHKVAILGKEIWHGLMEPISEDTFQFSQGAGLNCVV